MGLTVELVKCVFSKNRSVTVSAHHSNGRNLPVDKRRWSAVRSYLCGDEYNSVLAEDDSASARSSEATVTQPILEEFNEEENRREIQSKEHEEQINEEKRNFLDTKFLMQENAAIVIQSTFRGYLARRQYGEIKQLGENKEMESLSDESLGTSVEVQTGGSVENLQIQEQNLPVQPKTQHKSQTQVSRLKEEWDDSTVSSSILKLRIQNRLDATTRRERALAYAFSQQLRACTKRKPTCSDSTEPNLGWSWLERWMATRLPENSSVEDRLSKCLDPISCDRRSIIMKKMFDVAGEEKESCGSNDVSVAFDSLSITSTNANGGYLPSESRLKAGRTVPRKRTVPSYKHTTHSTKVSKKDSAEKEKKRKQMHLRKVGNSKCKEALSQAASDK